MGTYREYTETVYSKHNWQGFGADLVMVARLRAAQLIGTQGKLCGTIHDSIVCDAPDERVIEIGKLLKQSIEEVPSFCKKLWDYNFTLPLKCELGYGKNKTDMKELVIS